MLRRIRSRVNIEIDESDLMSTEALRRRLLRFGRRIFNPRVRFSPPSYQLRALRLERIPSHTLSANGDRRPTEHVDGQRRTPQVSPTSTSPLVGEATLEDVYRENEPQAPPQCE